MPASIADTIKSRRTIHQFVNDKIPAVGLIKEAIEYAIWAPNHHLSQPWHFHIIGAETADQICRLNAELVAERKGDKAAEIKLRRWREVPGWLLLTCNISADEFRNREDYAACCCVAQNLSLYLWDKGVGMKWTTGSVTRDARFFDIVRLDTQRDQIVGLFWYGYPEEVPRATRKPSAESVHILP